MDYAPRDVAELEERLDTAEEIRERKARRVPTLFPPLATFGHRRHAYARIHRFHNQIAWRRCSNASERLELLRKAANWHKRIRKAIRKSTRRHGKKVEALTGKSKKRQRREQYWLGILYGIPPESYYLFRLFEPERRRNVRKYLHRFETKRSIFMVLNFNLSDRRYPPMLQDKAEFIRHCRSHDLPSPELFYELQDGKVIPVEGKPDQLPPYDLIVKPALGKGGHGMMRWEYQGEGRYRDVEGEVLDQTALLDRFHEYGARVPFVVTRRVQVHPDMKPFAGKEGQILTTCRVITALNEEGRPEAVSSTYKIAIDQIVADNVHFGGVASPVDVATGTLGPGISTAPLGTPIDVHPISQVRITGARLPLWQQTIELACRAHETIPTVFIGWDIGITPDGPFLIEGNSAPCVHLQQTPHGKPLGDGRMAELLAYHIGRIDPKTMITRATDPRWLGDEASVSSAT